MDSVKQLDAEWHGNGETSFPALTHLTIYGMPNFEEWTLPDSGESFPCLKRLDIRSCPKLNGLPSLPGLKDLEIRNCSVALLRSIVFLTSLTSIRLLNFAELDVLPEGILQDHEVLEILEIDGMPQIRSLSNVLDNLSNLRSLSIEGCFNLEFVPEGLEHLHSLEKLRIGGFHSLTSFPATIMQDLSSLRTLEIRECESLDPLSGPLQRESALKQFTIIGCPEFKYLPESMQQFTSLRELVIIDCEELHSLPNWLGHLQSLSYICIAKAKYLNSLPDSFQSLKSLTNLEIDGCNPELENRCVKPEGEDWPKISHIPCIRINGKFTQ